MRGNGNTSILVKLFSCRKSPVNRYKTATVDLSITSLSFSCAHSLCSSKNALIRSGKGTNLIGEHHSDLLSDICPFSNMMAILAASDILSKILSLRGFVLNGIDPSAKDILNTKPLMFGGLLGLGCPNLSMLANNCALTSGISLRLLSSSIDILIAITSSLRLASLSVVYLLHLSFTFGFSLVITHSHNSSGNPSGLISGNISAQCFFLKSSRPSLLVLNFSTFSSNMTLATCIIS